MGTLEARPLKLPSVGSGAGCPVTQQSSLNTALRKMPGYGYGSSPAFLSGQIDWYQGAQAALLLIDSNYVGPLLVRPRQLDGTGRMRLVDEDLPPAANALYKERVPGRQASAGLEMDIPRMPAGWHAWFGTLSTSGPGCFGLQVDSGAGTEVIVVWVNSGAPPPG